MKENEWRLISRSTGRLLGPSLRSVPAGAPVNSGVGPHKASM